MRRYTGAGSILVLLLTLSLLFTACQSTAVTAVKQQSVSATRQASIQLPRQPATTPNVPLYPPTRTPQAQTTQGTLPNNAGASTHPVLAFYYPWYTQSSWTLSQMSDLPTIQYNSNDDTTTQRELNQAAGAGITGFINSWWGAGDKTDENFAHLLTDSSALESQTHNHFASSLYIECDAPNLDSTSKLISGLDYIKTNYSNNAHFFHWQGKPVLFFWDPLGGGRTLASWAAIRQQVDPNHQMLWSAEGVNINMLSVFDGLHLFSAGYWGLNNNTMTSVDQGFRNQINAYNQQHNTQKIWAAGVMPGYNDTRVPGRKGTFIVPRNNGATYTTSWNAAMASSPDWITITSYNEWFEGAMIEPSVTYGNLYLNLTRQFTAQWQR